MSGCLKDKTLLVLHAGEGTSAERTHLTECEACGARYRSLACDIQAISHALRQDPPPQTVNHSFGARVIPWMPATFAAALVLMLMWPGVWLWSPSGRAPQIAFDTTDSWTLLDALPLNSFLLNDALAVELATESAGSYELTAAVLESERPCEWYDLPALGRGEPPIEELEFSEGLRPVSCVEISEQNEKGLPKPQLSRKVS
jgi:hypothetical protein